MKAFALALLVSAAAAFVAHAETRVSGFQPRFGTTPAYPDEPNYRPANKPPNKYEFMIDASPDIDAERDDEGPKHDRPWHRHGRYKPHR